MSNTISIYDCRVCSQEVEPPMSQWLRERGLPQDAYKQPGWGTSEARQQWHWDTGSGDADDWPDRPASWGAWDGWRSKQLCQKCHIATL